jgi:RNA polymerase sigma-70 factor (ECF subfamily)
MSGDDQAVDLIGRLVGGDKAALEELYAAYGQGLYAYALRLTSEPAAAEDVVQEALVAAWRSAKNFRGEGRVIAWLLGIVHHAAMKSLRHSSQTISEKMEEELVEPGSSPEEAIQKKEQSRWIENGLNRLTPEHRAVLELVCYQKLSLQEIAQVNNCPIGTVKSRLSYARRYLRAILIGQDPGTEVEK